MSEPIGQTTTTAHIILAAYPGMDWDGIERTRSNKQGMSALSLKRIRFLAGSVFFGGGK